MSEMKGSRSQGTAGPAPGRGLRWRTVVILCAACIAVLAASLAVAFTTGSAKPAGRASQPPLVLKGKLTKRIPWAKLPATVIWNGRKDPDNRHKELQAIFRGQSIYKLVGLVDDKDPKTFNVAKAKRGYGVKFIAADGYSQTMSSRDIVGKRKWIVAKLKNGRPLPKTEGPYRDVGSFVGFLAGPSVKMLVRIELVFE